VLPAVVKHPQSGELSWFNHATFFHITTLDPVFGEVLLKEFAEEDLPTNTYYGDGSRIENEVAQHIREAYEAEMVPHAWEPGDVVLIDNILTAHARGPYVGPRRILFAMTEPFTRTDAISDSSGVAR